MSSINEKTAKRFLSEIYQLGMRERIKNLMENRGVNVKELSKLTGIPIATLYRIVSGKNKQTRLNTIRKLCDFFKVTPDELVRGQSVQLLNFNNIASVLAYLMEYACISQNELARQTNISQQAINKILTGETHKIYQQTLDKLKDFFKVSQEQLLGELPLKKDQIKGSNKTKVIRQKIPFVLWKNLYLLPDSLKSQEFIESPYYGPGVYATRILISNSIVNRDDILIVNYRAKFINGVLSLIQLEDRIAIGQIFIIDNKQVFAPIDSEDHTFELETGRHRKLGIVLHVVKGGK